MGRGLVGDDVEPFAGPGPGRLDLGGVADERDRLRPPGRGRAARPRECLVRVVRQPVDVADVEPPPGPRLVDLDREADAVVHRHRQRLGAAHPAEARRQRDPAAQRPAEVLARQLRERLVRALEDALRPDVDPRAGGHLAVHRQALRARARGRRPRSPIGRRGSSWRSAPAAPTRGSGTPRPACRSARAASRRRRGGAARGRSRRTPPSSGPRDRSRRRRRARRGSRRPPGRGCSSASGGPPPGPSRGSVSSGPRGARTGRAPAARRAIGGHRFEDTRPRGPSAVSRAGSP